jgi:uncharacterized membrane protein YdjX (TVP38/TMEM64 family)
MADHVDRLVARARWHATVPFIAVAALVAILVVLLGREAGHHAAAIQRWIADLGPAGQGVFVGLMALGTSLLIPESLFAVAAGALFGVPSGFATAFVGNVLVAVVQYALARRLLRGRIQRMLSFRPQLAAVQRAVLRDEARLQLLLRLTPLNAASLSYAFGAAGVRFSGFLFACVGLAPHVLMEVYLGHAGQRLTRLSAGTISHSFAHEAVTFGGLLVSALAVFIISRVARKAIERGLAPEEAGG